MTDAALDITVLLTAIQAGDQGAESMLMEQVVEELRRIAISRMPAHSNTLQATVLVNECYLRLAGRELMFSDRRHFYRLAALAMRDIVVEHARKNAALKRGGGQMRQTLHDVEDDREIPIVDLAACADAVDQLRDLHADAHEVLMYRFYTGLPYHRIAELMDKPEVKVRRLWKLAQVHLLELLGDEPDAP